MTPLGYIETSFLSLTAVAADAACKAGEVKILGFEPTGIETILIRLSGATIGALEAAIERGTGAAEALGGKAVSAILPSPPETLQNLNDNENSINPIYGGREEWRPTDYPENQPMHNQQAIGILETQGLTAILHATDAMLKAASVELVGKEKIGAAYVTIIIRGDVAAVSAALEAGEAAVGDLGKLIATQVIARPHKDFLQLLP